MRCTPSLCSFDHNYPNNHFGLFFDEVKMWSLVPSVASDNRGHWLAGGLTRGRRALLFNVLFAWFGYSGVAYLAAHPNVLPPAGADLIQGIQASANLVLCFASPPPSPLTGHPPAHEVVIVRVS